MIKGIATSLPTDKRGMELLYKAVEQALVPSGANTLLLLVGLNYAFKTRPELSRSGFSEVDAQALRGHCERHGIKLIPGLSLLGHQSDILGRKRGGILSAYPGLDETPDAETVDYTRCLCVSNPLSFEIASDLINETVSAFGADHIHLGLDEVLELGKCPRCCDNAPHELFAGWVNRLANVAKACGARPMMWADRLLDAREFRYVSKDLESATNPTADSIDLIDKSVVLCDWHYEYEPEGHRSTAHLTSHGFDVISVPWYRSEGTDQFLASALADDTGRMKGVLMSTWCDPSALFEALLGNESAAEDTIAAKVAANFFRVMGRL